jgi:DNA segregation ATPase FtsK/SpoIIIE, S-DNA-T family
MGRRRKRKLPKLNLKTDTVYSISAVILMLFGLIVIVSFSGQGKLLTVINQFLEKKFGLSMLFLPFIFISSGLVMLRTKFAWSKPNILLGGFLLMLASLGLFKSGEIGLEIFSNLSALITPVGSYFLFIGLFVIGLLVIGQWSVPEIIEGLAKLKLSNNKDKGFVEKGGDFDKEIKKAGGFAIPKLSLPMFGRQDKLRELENQKTGKLENKEQPAGKNLLNKNALGDNLIPNHTPTVWEYPPHSLLSSKGGGKANRGDVRSNAQIIENTLESFGIKAKVAEVNYGPSVTQYALEITKGTKLSKIVGLSTDLALALAAPTGQIRIEAPIAGRSLVGVEVPNYSPQFVTLKTMLESKEIKKLNSKLAVSLGIGVSGKPLVADITKMPHVLIAGSTGSGKSVAINSFLCTMLFRASPDEIKLILVDPKRVELTNYNGIPHLLTPVIVEPNKVVSALKWATKEMDKRYKQLAEVGVRNIQAYNELAGLAAMPNIMIVVDELADIMLYAPSEVEESITRIAQMARAVGIHLILATQRPSVDVITGLIKANIPTRIAFAVSSITDSRVILDSPGAEKLLGRGDMLYLPPDQAKPSRIQGTFVSDQEIKSMIDFLKSQGKEPEYEEDVVTKYQSNTIKGGSRNIATNASDRDELFTEAARLFSKYDKASSSLIQRRLSVGYARAARILDQLYESGFVGPAEGSKPREVNMAKIGEYLTSITQ